MKDDVELGILKSLEMLYERVGALENPAPPVEKVILDSLDILCERVRVLEERRREL